MEQCITNALIGGFVFVLLLSLILRETDWKKMQREITVARDELEALLKELETDSGL